MNKDAKEIILYPSRKALLVEWVLVLAPLSLLIIVLVFYTFPFTSSVFGLLPAVLIALFVLGGLTIGITYFCLTCKTMFKSTKYVINQDRVDVWETGISTKHSSYSMRGYTSMKLDKSGFGKVYDYGKLILFFMGGAQVELRNIEDPEKVMSNIEEILKAKSSS